MISVNITNLDSIMQKMDKAAEGLNLDDCVNKVEEMATSQWKAACSWAPKAASHIGPTSTLKGKGYSYVSVGLGGNAPFDSYKNAYFHNYGYNLVYFGNKTNRYIDMHKQWFDNAVQQLKAPISRLMRAEIKKKLEGAL